MLVSWRVCTPVETNIPYILIGRLLSFQVQAFEPARFKDYERAGSDGERSLEMGGDGGGALVSLIWKLF